MKIVFFGVGAVTGVMVRVLQDLAEKRPGKPLQLVLVARNRARAQQHFHNCPELFETARFIEVADFDVLLGEPQRFREALHNADLLVNASIPAYNLAIMRLALEWGAHYADLASDIYSDRVVKDLRFDQQTLQQEFIDRGLFALINLGISPGVTNFLIGERIDSFANLPYQTRVTRIEINLLEEIHSKQLVFSWSPNVAIEEISARPVYLKRNRIKTIEPFSRSKTYKFPYFENFVELYPVFQEELISLRQRYPEVADMRISVGGSEIELMKNLYQLNLLSNKYCFGYPDSSLSINDIIKQVIPRMKSPEVVEGYVRDKIIKYAEFSAVADLSLEIRYPGSRKPQKSIESIGVSFNRYRDLLKTTYAGATYISYPTGVGAGVLAFYCLLQRKHHALKGVLTTEQLPSLLGPVTNDLIKRELSRNRISLIHSIR